LKLDIDGSIEVYLQDTGLGYSPPPILTITRERQPTAGTMEFTSRRRVKFQLLRIEDGSAIYRVIAE
jgi:hypothetical protein